eukprot:4671471-Amphidinium_carterae.1
MSLFVWFKAELSSEGPVLLLGPAPGYPSDPPVLELVGDAPNEIRSTIQQLPQTQGVPLLLVLFPL